MSKNKQQAQQQQRLEANQRQARRNRKLNKQEARASQKNSKNQQSGNSANDSAKTTVSKKQGGGVKATFLKKLFGTSKAPVTAQQSLPFKEMCKDGICRIGDKTYNKTISFGDINYQLGATRI